jgi:hypothetical protein
LDEKTEQRAIAWAQVVLAALALLMPILSPWMKVLATTVAVPLWAFLTVAFLGVAAWLAIDRRRKGALSKALGDAEAVSKKVQDLESELQRRDDIDWSGDLPLRKSDPQKKALCPKCLSDTAPTYRPVHLSTLNGTPWFACDACGTSRAVSPQVLNSSTMSGGLDPSRWVDTQW